MDTTNEKSAATSRIVQVSRAPLGRLSAAATRLRLCPSPGRHVAVSAFNAPLAFDAPL